MIVHTVPILRVLVRCLTFSSYYAIGRVAFAIHFALHSQLIHSLFKANVWPKSCICSSVRSHRCGGCEESISGIGLCNTSSSSAYIWLKATGQERQLHGHWRLHSSDRHRRRARKRELDFRCIARTVQLRWDQVNIIHIRVSNTLHPE